MIVRVIKFSNRRLYPVSFQLPFPNNVGLNLGTVFVFAAVIYNEMPQF